MRTYTGAHQLGPEPPTRDPGVLESLLGMLGLQFQMQFYCEAQHIVEITFALR